MSLSLVGGETTTTTTTRPLITSRSRWSFVRPTGFTGLGRAHLLKSTSTTDTQRGSYKGLKVQAAATLDKHGDKEAPHWQLSLNEVAEKKKVCVAVTAPAVRVAIGEEFGFPRGTVTTGKMVAALKRLGYDYVFDVVLAADLTIMEEGYELLERLESTLSGKSDAKPLPMFTSCCPGWIQMVELKYPEMIPHVSSCKSPQMMFGALLKGYFPKKIDRKPSEVSVTSVMPCVRKQGEADRPWFNTTGYARDIDHVVTTKELAKMIKDAGIDYANLPDEEFDNPLGVGSGAGAIFGTTGGVMEAALRTVYEVASGEPMPRLPLSEVRGLEGAREATVHIKPKPGSPLADLPGIPPEGLEVNVAVVHGLGCAKKLMEDVKSGGRQYHFVEVMACPGGCIGGGGQPLNKDKSTLPDRQAGLYSVDERSVIRRSHENPAVQEIYDKWLEAPNSHKAHKALHTFYVPGGPDNWQPTEAVLPLPEDELAVCDICGSMAGEECGAPVDFPVEHPTKQ